MTTRLLPLEAYPTNATTDAIKDHIDNQLRQMSNLIPAARGVYLDAQDNDIWINIDGSQWVDHERAAYSPNWNPVLAMFAPFTEITTSTDSAHLAKLHEARRILSDYASALDDTINTVTKLYDGTSSDGHEAYELVDLYDDAAGLEYQLEQHLNKYCS